MRKILNNILIRITKCKTRFKIFYVAEYNTLIILYQAFKILRKTNKRNKKIKR